MNTNSKNSTNGGQWYGVSFLNKNAYFNNTSDRYNYEDKCLDMDLKRIGEQVRLYENTANIYVDISKYISQIQDKSIQDKSIVPLWGGKLLKSLPKYIKTSRKFTKNGSESIIYTKDGDDYIKKKNKTTGKFSYKKV